MVRRVIRRIILPNGKNWCVLVIPALDEIIIHKDLLKVTDLLGRDTKGTKNQPLIYIYDDGTVEKRITIE